jgi:hypothetical protein
MRRWLGFCVMSKAINAGLVPIGARMTRGRACEGALPKGLFPGALTRATGRRPSHPEIKGFPSSLLEPVMNFGWCWRNWKGDVSSPCDAEAAPMNAATSIEFPTGVSGALPGSGRRDVALPAAPLLAPTRRHVLANVVIPTRRDSFAPPPRDVLANVATTAASAHGSFCDRWIFQKIQSA